MATLPAPTLRASRRPASAPVPDPKIPFLGPVVSTRGSSAALEILEEDTPFAAEERRLGEAVKAAAEAAAKAAEDADETEARLRLAAFYTRHGLYAEALSTLEPLRDVGGDAARAVERVRLRAQFHLGRDEKVLALAAKADARDATAPLLRAAALARLGALREAAKAFQRVGDAAIIAPEHAEEIMRLRIEAAAAAPSGEAADTLGRNGQTDAGRAVAAAVDAAYVDRDARAFHKARLTERSGSPALLASSASGPIAWRAAIYGAVADLEGEVANDRAANIADLASRVLLRPIDPFLEREALSILGHAAFASGDAARAIHAWRRLIAHHPRADLAETARRRLADALPGLFGERLALPPLVAARLFYENIDFAPPGAAGDALIRRVAADLSALGLAREAAELLEHQTFQRLRGAARARLAAELAATRLAAGEPADALRAIRTSRITGLDEPLVDRRRTLEVESLAQLGRTDAALALLAERDDLASVRARADVLWRAERWAPAARAYAALYELDASPARRDAAVRAAAGFALAGDDAALAAFANRVDGPARPLVNALDNVDDAAAFFRSYQGLFETAGAAPGSF